jgi:hypothetical protein
VVTADPAVGPTMVALDPSWHTPRQMCGAIFTHPNTGKKQFICLRDKACRRQDHVVALKGEQFRALYQITRNPNNFYDGILSSEVSPEEYASGLVAARASNQEALRVSGQRPTIRTGLQVGFNSPMTQIIDGRPSPALGLSVGSMDLGPGLGTWDRIPVMERDPRPTVRDWRVPGMSQNREQLTDGSLDQSGRPKAHARSMLAHVWSVPATRPKDTPVGYGICST